MAPTERPPRDTGAATSSTGGGGCGGLAREPRRREAAPTSAPSRIAAGSRHAKDDGARRRTGRNVLQRIEAIVSGGSDATLTNAGWAFHPGHLLASRQRGNSNEHPPV